MGVQVHISPNRAQLNQAVAHALLDCALGDVAATGRFAIALAGGQTPRDIYALLAERAYAQRMPWPNVHVFFGDERCVAPSHSDSNFRMAHEALLSKVPIAPAHVHRLEGEADDLDMAAQRYEALLRKELKTVNGWPQFDVVLLGVGGDGHVASLFPDTPILNEATKAVACVRVDKLHARRLSVTYPVINNAKRVFIVAAGAAKAEIVAHVLNAHSEPRLPVQCIRPCGELHWFLDEAAAALLPRTAIGGS